MYKLAIAMGLAISLISQGSPVWAQRLAERRIEVRVEDKLGAPRPQALHYAVDGELPRSASFAGPGSLYLTGALAGRVVKFIVADLNGRLVGTSVRIGARTEGIRIIVGDRSAAAIATRFAPPPPPKVLPDPSVPPPTDASPGLPSSPSSTSAPPPASPPTPPSSPPGKLGHAPNGGMQRFGITPPGDECLIALPVLVGSSGEFENGNATGNPTDPAFSCVPGGPNQGARTMWLRFTSSSPEVVLRTASDAIPFPTVSMLVAVYSGTCGNLTELACGFTAATQTIDVPVTVPVGQEVFVQIATTAVGNIGVYPLTILGGAPPNDECVGAIEIPCETTVNADNESATSAGTDPLFSCAGGGPTAGVGTIWYRFTPTTTNAILETIPVAGSPVTDTILAVYAGGCGQLTEIGCSDDDRGETLFSRVQLSGLMPGVELFVQAATFPLSSTGAFDISLTCPMDDPGPANDNCVNATVLQCDSVVVGDMTGATTAVDDPAFSCPITGPTQGEGTVWYTFTPLSNRVILETSPVVGSAVTDTLLGLYLGSCGALVELACDDDSGTDLFSRIDISGVQPGLPLIVQVASFPGQPLGEFQLSIDCPVVNPTPPNDDVANAILLGPLPASAVGDTTGGTSDVEIPCGVAAGPFNNVWYRVTGTGGTLTATTCNAGTPDFDTVISVFCGNVPVGTVGMCVAGNDDDCPSPVLASTVTWCSQLGVDYLITVGGTQEGAVGAFQLDVLDMGDLCTPTVFCEEPPPPMGDICFRVQHFEARDDRIRIRAAFFAGEDFNAREEDLTIRLIDEVDGSSIEFNASGDAFEDDDDDEFEFREGDLRIEFDLDDREVEIRVDDPNFRFDGNEVTVQLILSESGMASQTFVASNDDDDDDHELEFDDPNADCFDVSLEAEAGTAGGLQPQLDIDSEETFANGSFEVEVYGGAPGAPVALFLVESQGMPTAIKVAEGFLGEDGRAVFSDFKMPSLMPLDLDLAYCALVGSGADLKLTDVEHLRLAVPRLTIK